MGLTCLGLMCTGSNWCGSNLLGLSVVESKETTRIALALLGFDGVPRTKLFPVWKELVWFHPLEEVDQ